MSKLEELKAAVAAARAATWYAFYEASEATYADRRAADAAYRTAYAALDAADDAYKAELKKHKEKQND